MPVGSSARGGKKLASHELGDLLDRRLAREPGGLPMASAARLSRDRRDVELVDACPQTDATSRAVLSRRLADQHRHVRSLDRTQEVDDALGVVFVYWKRPVSVTSAM